MSKLLWILGAGAGVALLAGTGRDDSPSNEDDVHPDEHGGGNDDTPDPDPVVEPKPDPGGDEEEHPSIDPWVLLPYDEYERGPYTIDLAGLSTGVRWRVYATAAKPPTETAKDVIKLGAGIEVSDEEARIAANAYADALGALPVEPYPMPPKPTPDPPEGEPSSGGDGPPESAWSPVVGTPPSLVS